MNKRNYIIVNTADYPTTGDAQEILEMEKRIAEKEAEDYVALGGIGVRNGSEYGIYFVQAMVLKQSFLGSLFSGGE